MSYAETRVRQHHQPPLRCAAPQAFQLVIVLYTLLRRTGDPNTEENLIRKALELNPKQAAGGDLDL